MLITFSQKTKTWVSTESRKIEKLAEGVEKVKKSSDLFDSFDFYKNNCNGHWKGISVIPYGSFRIGEKLKNIPSDLADELLATRRFD